MPYDAELLHALAQIEKNQGDAKFKAEQPKEICKGAPEKRAIACAYTITDGKLAFKDLACDQAFDPHRAKEDSSKWCSHEKAAMPVFEAISKVAEIVRTGGAYEKFCEAIFKVDFKAQPKNCGVSNVKQLSRGCYKIAKPKRWACNEGNWQNLKDVLRISIAFDDLHSLYAGAKALVGRVGVIGSGKGMSVSGNWEFGPIYRIKDRFATPPIGIFDEKGKISPEAEAEVIYKDYQVILAVKGPLALAGGWFTPYFIELQLHVKSMLEAKQAGGHKLYQQMRVLKETQRAELISLVQDSNKVYAGGFEADKRGGLNDEIDYLHPDLVAYIAKQDIKAGDLARNWTQIMEKFLRS